MLSSSGWAGGQQLQEHQSCPMAELTWALLLLARLSPLAIVELPSCYGMKKRLLVFFPLGN